MVPACYGFAIPPEADISRLNSTSTAGPRGLDIGALDVTVEARSHTPEEFREDFVRLVWDFGGSAELDRRKRSIVLGGAPDPEYLPHPMLVASTSIMAHWDGRVSLHAASVVVDGRALLLVGEKFSGKSTLVGALAVAGHPVIADDVSIVGDGHVTPGPRLVDLRPPAELLLGVAERTVTVRSGANRRLSVGPAPDRVPLGSIVSLEWGERWSIEPLDAHQRFALVVGALMLDASMASPPALTDLLVLPAWRFVRPRSGARDLTESARWIALLAAGRPPRELEQGPGAGVGTLAEPD